MPFTTNAAPVLKMQNYQAYNRADMFVPNPFVNAPLRAAALATPYSGRQPVHSVPVLYGNIQAQMIGNRGMSTPVQGGVK